MKYHACPKEELCGEYFITPPSDGSIVEISPAENMFQGGNLCTYQIGYPGGVRDKDRISVQLDALYQAKVKFIVSTSFASNDYQQADMYMGANMSIAFPFKAYLTAISESVGVGGMGSSHV